MATESTPATPEPNGAPRPAARTHRGRKVAAIVLASVVGLVALAAVAVLVLTNTDWGREQLRRRVVAILNETAHGHVRVGRISGNLLKGLTLHDVAITDSANAPFLTLDSATTRYGLRSFVSKKIELSGVTLWRPVVVLDRPPGADWNWARIFPGDTTKPAGDTTQVGWGDYFVLHDVRVRDGDVTVRIPWEPDSGLAGAARDSAVRVSLDTTTVLPRQRVVRVPRGFQQVQYFHRLSGVFPLLQIAKPGERARRIEIDSVRVAAFPFRRPGADVRQARGVVLLDADSLWFRDLALALPDSRATLTGRYGLEDGGLAIAGRGAPAALHDVRFLYPALPDSGTATLDFRVAMGGDGNMAFRFMNMDLRSRATTMQGDLGISFRPELRIDTTNVRFAGVTTQLLEQLVPAAKSPRAGTLSGRLAADGDLGELTLDGDVAFDEPRTGRSRIAAVGTIGADSGVVRARNLRVRMAPVQVALARIFSPTLPVAGTLAGTATVNGSTDTRLAVTAMNLTHADRGAVSRLVGRATVALGGGGGGPAPSPEELRRGASSPAPLRERDRARIARSSGRDPWFDVDISARPLSLVTVGRFAPAIGLRGTARGPIRARGTLRDFAVTSALVLSDGGRLAVAGRLGVGEVPTYDLRAQLALFNANSVVAKAPQTSITATASVRGRGSDPKTMVAALDADVSTSRIDTVAIDSSRARLRVANALLTVDTLAVRAPRTTLDVLGTFGLAAGRSGELSYRAATDSLGALARYLPRLTGAVAPRPAILAERVQRARADSALAAQRNAVRIAMGERQAVRALPVDTPQTIAKDSLAGAVYAGGVLTGSLERFDVKGRAGAVGLVALGHAVQRARVAYAGTAVRTKEQSFAVAGVADSLMVGGFALDSVDARATYREPGGNVQVAVFQNQGSDLGLRADYGLYPDRKELLLGRLTMRFDTTLWAATHASAVRWGQPGVEVENLELLNGVGGRLFVDGRLPTGGAADMRLQVENFQVADVLGLLQSDVPLRGYADVDATITGPLTAPIIRATAQVDSALYDGTVLPDLRATADYADGRIAGRAEARSSALAAMATARGARVAATLPDTGRVLAVGTGSLPINLALQGVTGPRMADDAPVVAEFRVDSLPLDVAARFTDAVSDVRGTARGTGTVRGTVKAPEIAGDVTVVDAGFRVTAAGIRMRDVNGAIHLRGDSVVIDSIAGRTDGRIAIAGGIGIRDLAKPSVDLRVTVDRATVLDNETGRVRANAQISAYGPFDGVYLSGGARVLGGVIYVPESDKKQVISQGDPAVFAVIDTTRLTGEDELIPAQSPLLANLRADLFVGVDRDTWVRSREANVEVYSDGDLRLRVDRAKQALVLDGIMNTDRGQYTFLSKRFLVKSGAATFIGTQELDPNLQLVAEYEVPQGRPPLTIRILIGGTLSAPRISLESDAQPPIPQSDLLSYLAFGSNTGQLLAMGGGSSVSSQTAGGGLVGTTAALARKQLTSVVTGVMVDQLESRTGRSLGADVFNITPVPGLPEELASGNFGGGLSTFVRGTQVEFGKYFNRQLYVAFQATPVFFEGTPPIPGFVVQYRFARLFGLILESNWQPRYFLPPPSLSPTTDLSPKNAFGLFLVRNWRF